MKRQDKTTALQIAERSQQSDRDHSQGNATAEESERTSEREGKRMQTKN